MFSRPLSPWATHSWSRSDCKRLLLSWPDYRYLLTQRSKGARLSFCSKKKMYATTDLVLLSISPYWCRERIQLWHGCSGQQGGRREHQRCGPQACGWVAIWSHGWHTMDSHKPCVNLLEWFILKDIAKHQTDTSCFITCKVTQGENVRAWNMEVQNVGFDMTFFCVRFLCLAETGHKSLIGMLS